MKRTVLLLLCVQVLYSTATRKKEKESELAAIPCNDPGAQAAADLSLRQLNEIRKNGDVYALKRITSVQEQYEDETGTVYYLTLDVVETDCHVLSRKDWKDCRPKSGSDAVFGQCKVVFHLSKTQRIAQLYNYDCTLRPIVRGPGGCPGCPVPVSLPLNDSSFLDIANRAIKKFNEKSNYDKYFTIGNITKAAAQVIAGVAYNVEFSILETTCNKSLSAVELTLCEPLDCEFAHTGYCKSRSLAHWSRSNDPYVSVTCKVFEPEASAGEEEKHKDGHAAQKPDRTSGRGQSEKREDKKGKKEGDGRKRDNNHEHNHQHLHPYEHHHEQEGQGRGRQSDSVKPVGKIRYEGTEEEVSKDKPGKKNPEKEKGTRGDRTPRRANNPADRQVRRPVIRSFPEDVAASAQCPGDVREYVPPPAPEDTTALPF